GGALVGCEAPRLAGSIGSPIARLALGSRLRIPDTAGRAPAIGPRLRAPLEGNAADYGSRTALSRAGAEERGHGGRHLHRCAIDQSEIHGFARQPKGFSALQRVLRPPPKSHRTAALGKVGIDDVAEPDHRAGHARDEPPGRYTA